MLVLDGGPPRPTLRALAAELDLAATHRAASRAETWRDGGPTFAEWLAADPYGAVRS